MLPEQLVGKRVALYGLARETTAFLQFLGRTSNFKYDLLNDSPVTKLPGLQLAPDRVVTGDDIDVVIGNYDYIIRSPGVSIYKPSIVKAQSLGSTVLTANQFWFDACSSGKIIAVTGTKGKSTTTTLIAHMLRSFGAQVIVAGNIGTAIFEHQPDHPVDYWVIELSSFQLADLEFSPDTALVLNLYPEHLDWHLSTEHYYRDKLRILANVKEYAVVGPQVQEASHLTIQDKLLRIEPTSFVGEIEQAELPQWLCHSHNIENLQAALSVVASNGYDVPRALESLHSFRTLPYRQEVVFEQDLLVVNDSISTIPQSVRAALDSFKERPIILIFGGKDRGLNWEELTDIVGQKTFAAIGSFATGKIIYQLAQGRYENIHFKERFADAVSEALKIAPPNSVVLFSPGAPSAAPYNNYEERGAEFNRLIHEHFQHS